MTRTRTILEHGLVLMPILVTIKALAGDALTEIGQFQAQEDRQFNVNDWNSVHADFIPEAFRDEIRNRIKSPQQRPD